MIDKNMNGSNNYNYTRIRRKLKIGMMRIIRLIRINMGIIIRSGRIIRMGIMMIIKKRNNQNKE